MELEKREQEIIEANRREFAEKLAEATKLSHEITDATVYARAAEMLVAVKQRKKGFLEWFAPLKRKVDEMKRLLLDQEHAAVDPLVRAEAILGRACSDWDTKQEAERRAVQEKAQAEYRKQEEDARLARAAELEAQGRKEEAGQVLDSPVAVPAVVIQKEKTPGLSFRTVWKFRIVNAALIPRQYLTPDEKAIGGVVRSLQDKAGIPGVEVYSEKTAAASGRSSVGV